MKEIRIERNRYPVMKVKLFRRDNVFIQIFKDKVYKRILIFNISNINQSMIRFKQ